MLLNEDLRTVAHLLDQARRTRHIIRQNLIWAGAYNIIAVPLAVLGYVQPWIAALGMSFSSLAVLGNALRLHKRGKCRLKNTVRTMTGGVALDV